MDQFAAHDFPGSDGWRAGAKSLAPKDLPHWLSNESPDLSDLANPAKNVQTAVFAGVVGEKGLPTGRERAKPGVKRIERSDLRRPARSVYGPAKTEMRAEKFRLENQRGLVKIAFGIITCTPTVPSTSCVMSTSLDTLTSR